MYQWKEIFINTMRTESIEVKCISKNHWKHEVWSDIVGFECAQDLFEFCNEVQANQWMLNITYAVWHGLQGTPW